MDLVTNDPVLVTGGTGFLAAHLVHLLLVRLVCLRYCYVDKNVLSTEIYETEVIESAPQFDLILRYMQYTSNIPLFPMWWIASKLLKLISPATIVGTRYSKE